MALGVGIIVLMALLGIAGGAIQGVIGFGQAVVVAPILALVRPDLVPTAVLISAPALTIATLAKEWRHADWKALLHVMLGRLPATLAAAYVVVAVPTRVLQGIVGVVVLLMALLNVVRLALPERPATLALAGVVSGITGTASGIGGPPIALVLGHEDPARSRATLACTFFVGSCLSLGSLALAGAVRPAAIGASLLVLVPATLVGFAIALRLRPHVTPGLFRAGMLTVSCVAALGLVGRALGL